MAQDDLLTHRLDGEGETVLLLNGGMMSLGAWEGPAEPLFDEYRVLRCDFRGQLLSPGEGHDELSGHVDDLVRLLDHLELDTVHVLGVSFGAEVGLLLAATAPERVRTLAAVTATDVVTDSFRHNSRRMRRILADVLDGGDRGPFHDAMVEDVFAPAWAERHREVLAARRAAMGAVPVEWFRGLDAILRCTEKVDLRPRLKDVTAPTLVVIAGQDRVMLPERSRALAEAVGGEVAELPESGHGLVMEHPKWMIETYQDFLGRWRKRVAEKH